MFEGGRIECECEGARDDQAAREADRERAWMRLHRELKAAFQQRVALEAREVELLLEADETRLYRRLGYTSIYSYIEGELGHSHHVATERMRVGYELRDLPQLADLFRAGELPWTSVRELTRVVTARTEDAWLDAIEGKRVDQVQQLVRGKGKGALPDDPVDPAKIRYRIVLENVSAEAYAMHRQARIAAAEAAAAAGGGGGAGGRADRSPVRR